MSDESLRSAFEQFRASVEGADLTTFFRLYEEDSGICPVCSGIALWSGGTPRCREEGCGVDISDELRRWVANEPPPKLRRLPVGWMVREQPPPVPWVIEGLVVRGMLTVLNGREGEGKSLLAMGMAAGVLTGHTEAGLPCEKGRVVIVDGENGQYEIHRRIWTLGLPSSGVEVFEADGFDLRSDLHELGRILEQHQPDLVVLDSFRSLWGGKENDSGEVAGVLDPLRNLVRKTSTGALLLHHSGRANGTYRGSSAIGASAELGFKLARKEDDRDPTRRYLEAWKCRPSARPPRRWILLSAEEKQIYLSATEAPEGSDIEQAPVQDSLTPRVLDVLKEKPQSRADIARAVDRDPKDRSVGRVLEALRHAGKAQKVGSEARPLWKVAGPGPPTGSHPATSIASSQRRAENEGGSEVATFAPPATFANGSKPRAGSCEGCGTELPHDNPWARCLRCST